MNKILTIGWKDLTVIFRDRAALILMLLAPFILTLGMGMVTGSFSDSGSGGTGLADIPVMIVNEDAGELGKNLVTLLKSDDLAELLTVDTTSSISEARRQVDDNEIAALIIIPTGFSAGILPDQSGGTQAAAPIELYTNPARPISSSVVSSIVDGFVSQVETGVTAVSISITQLISNGLVSPDPASIGAAGQALAAQLGDNSAASPITLVRNSAAETQDDSNNAMAFFAPGMALFFLMYTVTLGGRSFLAERDEGTLPRLMVSPTSSVQVLGGKVLGIFLTGVVQVGILIVASSLIFGLTWGDPLGVGLLIMATAAAATGWGMVLASFAKTPAQITSLGSTVMLIFGIMGGSFLPVPDIGFLNWVSKITPHAWALDGFSTLSQGGTLANIATSLLALLIMAAVLFTFASFSFRRSGALAN